MTREEYESRMRHRLRELQHNVAMATVALDVGIEVSVSRIDDIQAAAHELETLDNHWRSTRGLRNDAASL